MFESFFLNPDINLNGVTALETVKNTNIYILILCLVKFQPILGAMLLNAVVRTDCKGSK